METTHKKQYFKMSLRMVYYLYILVLRVSLCSEDIKVDTLESLMKIYEK